MRWLRYSALNVLEYAVTRGADILITLSIVWGFPTQSFSILATAQALVAPLLFFFPPVHILYREFAAWKGKSINTLAGNIWVLRRLGWGLGHLALFFSIVVAAVMPIGENYFQRFWALVWAFALTVGINVFAADRELLRLELKMRALNGVTLYQKLSALVGTLIVVRFFPGRIDLLALAVVGSVITTAWIANRLVVLLLHERGASNLAITGREVPSVFLALRQMFVRFSLWNHFCGVIWNWVQSMDLFFLGVAKIPALQLGLYAVALKIANLSLALPMALANVFAVWVGRRPNGQEQGDAQSIREERSRLIKYTIWLFGGGVVQALLIYGIAPFVIHLLSHGRWGPEQHIQILAWLRWMLFGSVLFGSSFLLFWWLMLRADVLRLLRTIYVPLLVGSILIYGGSVFLNGTDGAARANVAIGLIYITLLLNFLREKSEQRLRACTGSLVDAANPPG